VHRYDLSAADLNILQDTFVAKYLKDGHNGKHLESFTEEELKKLSTWIKILFNSESISDELLSTCTPQEFYLLVPTMFSQIIFAQSAQIFPSNALNTPFECMLLPSDPS
jgi:mediator of RNA polymerase II transcription subunit 5